MSRERIGRSRSIPVQKIRKEVKTRIKIDLGKRAAALAAVELYLTEDDNWPSGSETTAHREEISEKVGEYFDLSEPNEAFRKAVSYLQRQRFSAERIATVIVGSRGGTSDGRKKMIGDAQNRILGLFPCNYPKDKARPKRR